MTDTAWHQADTGLLFIQFSHIAATGLVEHGITTRTGGFSTGQWATLNVGYMAGDQPQHVRANRRLICESMGLTLDAWTNGRQQHTDHIERVAAEDRGRGAYSSEDCFPGTDGLITDQPDILLAAFFADCTPLLLLDPVQPAIGVVHAGWKGTAKGIAARTVAEMTEAYGTKPEDILAGIGPSIGPCCYEVDEPVIDQFADARFGRCLQPAVAEGKAFLDLVEANRQCLIHAGVNPTKIQTVSLCTSCRTDLFFSHRKEQGRTGRLAAVMAIKNSTRRR
jgi:polyphenol oxidase